MSEPYLTRDLPGIGGRLRVVPEDFVVEEIPAYEPAGSGDHLFLWIEKRGLSAEMLLDRVSRQLGVRRSDVGVAGLKDRHAVTRQYVSVPARADLPLGALEAADLHLLRYARHPHKLRTGHLRGNRFEVLVREVSPHAVDRVAAIAGRIAQTGAPNYFGEQRFGREGETERLGFALLRGERQPADLPPRRRKFLLRLALSAAQARLFNVALEHRLQQELLNRVLWGDVLQVAASGGTFRAEDVPVEQQRLDRHETRICGPLFGPKMLSAAGDVAAREQRVLADFDLDAAAFAHFGRLTQGTRRPYCLVPEEFQYVAEPDGIRFRFTLPAGTYATTLLREFMKSDLPPDGC